MGKGKLLSGALLLTVFLSATSARAEGVDRRAFLQACLAMVALPLASSDELGLESYGQSIRARLVAAGVPAAEAERTRWNLQSELWAEIQRRALAAARTEETLTVSATATVTAGTRQWRLAPRFRVELGGYLSTARGRERVIESIDYLGGGDVL